MVGAPKVGAGCHATLAGDVSGDARNVPFLSCVMLPSAMLRCDLGRAVVCPRPPIDGTQICNLYGDMRNDHVTAMYM